MLIRRSLDVFVGKRGMTLMYLSLRPPSRSPGGQGINIDLDTMVKPWYDRRKKTPWYDRREKTPWYGRREKKRHGITEERKNAAVWQERKGLHRCEYDRA